MATVITNINISDYVKIYCTGDRNQLPPNLRKPIGDWDVSQVTNMSHLFSKFKNFNEPLNWNVSKVTNMSFMFNRCENFNSPLTWNDGPWDVSKVTNMDSMFADCKKFNQPIGNWDVSNVTNMENMFYNCEEFNKPLYWNLSTSNNTSNIFTGCKNFDILNNFLLTSKNYILWQLFNKHRDLDNFAKTLGIDTEELPPNQLRSTIEEKIEEKRLEYLLYAITESGKHQEKEKDKTREKMRPVLETLTSRGTLRSLKKSKSVPALKNYKNDAETAAMLTAFDIGPYLRGPKKGGKKTKKQRKQKYKMHNFKHY